MRDDTAACADLVRRADADRFRAVMAAPPEARPRLFAIYACNLEIARAPWVTAEPMIAEMRLQWWRDALAEIHSGGTVRSHEVVLPLSEAIDGEGARLLDELTVARRWDIYKDPFEDAEGFRAYIDRTSANLLVVAARALGPAPERPLRDAGYAMGVANWLRAVPALERAGRVPLVDGRPGAVRELAEEGLDALARARAQRRSIPGPARPAMLVLWQTGAILGAARSDPGRVADGRLDPAPFRSRLMLIARAATGRW